MKILVTGDTGLVGSSFCSIFDHLSSGNKRENIYKSHQAQRLDLRNIEEVKDMFYDAKTLLGNDFVTMHFSATVGGIEANINNQGQFFYDNILINTNILEVARIARVKKLISLASTCVYPDNCAFPLKEKDLHNGEPHFSNYGYAFSKRMLDVQSRAYRDQYGCNFVVAIPTNVYGIKDNYNLQNGHVIPVLIHKIYRAKIRDEKYVELYGSGRELRDFIFADDLSRALMFIAEKYNEREPINVATGEETSIREIAEKICFFLGYVGEIRWTNKMSGQMRKPVDITKIKALGWTQKISIDEGIKKTCKWFIENYPNVRK
jgi:GDP-L-fucose synthase